MPQNKEKAIIPAPAATEATPNTQQQADKFPVNAVTARTLDPLASQYPDNEKWNFEDFPILTPEIWNRLQTTKGKEPAFYYHERPVFQHPEALKNPEFKNILCILPTFKNQLDHNFINSFKGQIKSVDLSEKYIPVLRHYVLTDTTGNRQEVKFICISFHLYKEIYDKKPICPQEERMMKKRSRLPEDHSQQATQDFVFVPSTLSPLPITQIPPPCNAATVSSNAAIATPSPYQAAIPNRTTLTSATQQTFFKPPSSQTFSQKEIFPTSTSVMTPYSTRLLPELPRLDYRHSRQTETPSDQAVVSQKEQTITSTQPPPSKRPRTSFLHVPPVDFSQNFVRSTLPVIPTPSPLPITQQIPSTCAAIVSSNAAIATPSPYQAAIPNRTTLTSATQQTFFKPPSFQPFSQKEIFPTSVTTPHFMELFPELELPLLDLENTANSLQIDS